MEILVSDKSYDDLCKAIETLSNNYYEELATSEPELKIVTKAMEKKNMNI